MRPQKNEASMGCEVQSWNRFKVFVRNTEMWHATAALGSSTHLA